MSGCSRNWEGEYKRLEEETNRTIKELKEKIIVLETSMKEKCKEYEACTSDYIKIKEEKAELENKVTKLRYTIKNIAEML